MKDEEGQNFFKERFEKLPNEIEELYTFISENALKFHTFDLLSYFAYYNHLHDSEDYKDYRGDKSFIVPETLSLLCLKGKFVNTCSVPKEEYFDKIKEMQSAIRTYCARCNLLVMSQRDNKDKRDNKGVIAGITKSMYLEASNIRNPGLPDHHLIFAEKLFGPIRDEIMLLYGFSISDSIIIRKHLSKLINSKCQAAHKDALRRSDKLANEIVRYRKTRRVDSESKLSKEQLEEYADYHYHKIKEHCRGYFLSELFYSFSEIYTFSSKELSEFTNLNLEVINAFLNTFSCGFPSLEANDKIYSSVTLLKSRPILEHNGKYLISSLPLMTWAVEHRIEEAIRRNKKLSAKYDTIKHDFLLNQGLEYLREILPTATFFKPNLFYSYNNDICETDGIILYDNVLFIIEGKGNRISDKARSGHELKTLDHMKAIIRDSYAQGIRTKKFIEDTEIASFYTKNGDNYSICRADYEEVVIVSLTLEPIGNLSMLIKATNEIGFFKDGNFPWIISLYDLVVIADLIENPLLFIHYIRRRENFLRNPILSTTDELDLISYFLASGIFVDDLLQDAKDKNVSGIEYISDSDAINDYYLYKFGHKTKLTPKPKAFISEEFNKLLLQLDNSKLPHRVRAALLILEASSKSIKKLMDYVKKIKQYFFKDEELHDCSIWSSSSRIGITFMTGVNQGNLSFELKKYCTYKINEQGATRWIGLGDSSTNPNTYDFTSIFLLENGKVTLGEI